MNDRLVVIQRNPKSGSGPRREKILELIASLKAHGFRPHLFSKRERLAEFLDDPQRLHHLVCIVAAGGDGTIGDVINRYPGVPLAIFPLGTENLFARYLGIPRSGQAVADIIAAGRIRQMDLGLANGRRFSLMVSCGFDADVIHRLHDGRRGHIRKYSYLQPILQSLRKYDYPEIRVNWDGVEKPRTGRLALLANLPMYAMHLPVARSAVGDDGLLDLRLFQRGSAFQMIRYIYKVACGKHERLQDVETAQVRRVHIDSDVPVPVQIDGDPAGFTPLEIEVLPKALEVLVPTNDSTEH
ncbi:MAG: diacylglycerol kinase family lipid kinase [Planctomycetes bacterium]|nr:diacylglycerol kinase family lipid kinase [Planctomycetota bacterium]